MYNNEHASGAATPRSATGKKIDVIVVWQKFQAACLLLQEDHNVLLVSLLGLRESGETDGNIDQHLDLLE